MYLPTNGASCKLARSSTVCASGFTREPDGSFTWGVFSTEGKHLQHGVSDSWDDARLAMIENVYPPSDEATADKPAP